MGRRHGPTIKRGNPKRLPRKELRARKHRNARQQPWTADTTDVNEATDDRYAPGPPRVYTGHHRPNSGHHR